ncbi:histidine phosphatase family protein [Pedobacter nototheniae]|uniref:histidine phosphatase family protein n=1 Tax=Pedobacter nototheniae TaxID=2488994 RepID=UPI00292EC842|nr:histidine phosphatase family protein [Pedobacter nototheniae]
MFKKKFPVFIVIVFLTLIFNASLRAQDNLKIILIRHAEKPAQGDNLNCQGLNRSMQLPAVIVKKFGLPNYVYVPNLNATKGTKRSRAFQTVLPLSIKYNLSINSSFDVEDSKGLVNDISAKKGLVLVCWEHHELTKIMKAFGVKPTNLKWAENDFDGIWTITYQNGKAVFSADKENLKPKINCTY